MNSRQRRFCEAYSANPNATQAAIAAGYAPGTAYSQGSRLLKNVEVLSEIQRLDTDKRSENEADIHEVRAFWTEIMRDAFAKQSDRLKASELIARSRGAFFMECVEDNRPENVMIYIPHNNRDTQQT